MASKRKDLFSYLELVDYEAVKDEDPFISLSMGAPGPPTLKGCSEIFVRATEETLKDAEEEKFTFQYGAPQGDGEFCDQMSKFLTSEYGDTVNSDDIMVTAGATQGLHFMATVLFDKSTPVFMEDPTYFIAVNILRKDLGMNIISVPTDKNGVIVEKLEELLIQHRPPSTDGQKSPFWSFFYTIPTFNNPTGQCLSPERCKALVQLARKYDILLLAEDVYNLIHFSPGGHPPPRLLAYDNRSDPDFKGHVVSNCTFSKIVAPGLRLGWIEASPRIMKLLEKSNTAWSGGSFNHYMSKLITTTIKNGSLSQRVEWLRQEYGERMKITCDELKKNLPEGVKWKSPRGGLFVWLELPESVDCGAFLKFSAENYRINFIHGASTSPTGSFSNYARLAYCFCNKDQIGEGVRRFCAALKDFMAK